MSRVRFELTTPMFEWAETVRVLNRVATVIDISLLVNILCI
jgi:hypothetical protein